MTFMSYVDVGTTMKLRTASESVGWMNSVGPLTVSPHFLKVERKPMPLALVATATTTKEITLKPQVRRKLLTELHAYQELKQQYKALEFALDAHKATIERLREETGEQSIALEGFKVTQVTQIRSTLDKKLLLEQGVTMGQIENATITKSGRPYTKVTTPGEKEYDG